ncbi:VCBS repeat protein [Fluviicoccus keumensis]|uniref:VCBS repeat protein n=1 Tax=Fluviicoccus keumensis TaxID=1435465 RepID=A0A4Q7ZCP3_9GAMM|nr:FG-GAP-like repeat-containing protein [Fluviicoccus keumensis]RZU47974.1 VCBS repeat protein [Fluviicoccus keumensis]
MSRYPHALKMPATLLALSLLLNACGGGDSGSTKSAAPSDPISGNFIPTQTGARWVYQTADSSSNAPEGSTSIQEITGKRLIAGNPAYDMVSHNAESGDPEFNAFFSIANQTVSLWAEDGSTHVDLMRLPLHIGDHFVQTDEPDQDSGSDYDGDGINERMSIHYELTVAGMEAVDVPAGHFGQALKIETRGTQTLHYSRSGSNLSITYASLDWYVDGIGQVKSMSQTHFPDPAYDYGFSQQLLAYRIGELGSDKEPPQLSQLLPAADSTQSALPIFSADFSEDMDGASFRNDNVQLLDKNNQPVSGYTAYAKRRLTFTPSAPLASGRYTLRIRGSVTDRVGNSLGTDIERTITADADAPALLSSIPVDNATIVPLDSPILLTFSEAVDPTTLVVQLQRDDNSERILADQTVNGSRVTLKPREMLQRGKRYTVRVNNLRDLNGNAAGWTPTLSFTADSGMFQTPVYFHTGSWAEAVAVGDLDGDGRKDIVMTTGFEFDNANDYTLMVFMQQGDGTLSGPTRVRLKSTYVCKATSVAIANMTGDSLPEVVVGEGNCGVEILSRDSAGQWQSTKQLAGTNGYQIRTADFNGDGKTDIVGAGRGTGTVTFWMQYWGGFGVRDYDINHSGQEDLAIGDINGDGRIDLAVISGQGDSALGVILQNPDRNFGTAFYPDTGGRKLNSGTIGDVNGDGRDDLLFTAGGDRPDSLLCILQQQASGKLGTPMVLPSQDISGSTVTADMDNDGRTDVIIAHFGWASVGLFLQSATGQLEPETLFNAPYTAGYNPQGMAVDDVNGDGFKDIVLADYNGNLAVLYNRLGSVPAITKSRTGTPVSRQRKSAPLPMLHRQPAKLRWLMPQ